MLHDCCDFAVLLFYPFSASNIHVWFATGFHVGFKVPPLLFGLLRASDTGSSSAVSAMSLRASGLFQFVRFRFVQVSARFCRSASFLWCTLDFLRLLFLSVSCLSPKFLRLSRFPLRFLQVCCQIFCAVHRPASGSENCRDFCQVLEGPPEYRVGGSKLGGPRRGCVRMHGLCTKQLETV